MMDPIILARLAKIRQQEFLDQAAEDREPRISLINWSRLLEPLQAFLQRRSRRVAFRVSTVNNSQIILEECPCE